MLNSEKKIFDIDRVSRLSMILNYQLGSAVLVFLTYATGITIWLVTIAAILFTPYLIYVLLKEKRNGWIVAFAIIVVVPSLVSIFIGLKLGNSLFSIVALAFFYFYCFMLKYSTKEWVKEYNWKLVLDEQKKEKQQRLKDEMNMFN